MRQDGDAKGSCVCPHFLWPSLFAGAAAALQLRSITDGLVMSQDSKALQQKGSLTSLVKLPNVYTPSCCKAMQHSLIAA